MVKKVLITETKVYKYDPMDIDYADMDKAKYQRLLDDGALRSWPPETVEERMLVDMYDVEAGMLDPTELGEVLEPTTTTWKLVEE